MFLLLKNHHCLDNTILYKFTQLGNPGPQVQKLSERVISDGTFLVGLEMYFVALKVLNMIIFPKLRLVR